MDNNEVYTLFEDIKNDLKGIEKKLENTPRTSSTPTDVQSAPMDLTPVKQAFEESAARHQETNKAMLTKYAEAEVRSLNRILQVLRGWTGFFAQFTQSGEPQEHIHRHSLDIKSSKVFSLLVGMGVACSLSVWGNIELWQSKRQYADDALKFRAIRSWGGCNASTILWLNEVFDIHRDEEAIEWVRGQADGYDKGLKIMSYSLMQENLKVKRMNDNNKK